MDLGTALQLAMTLIMLAILVSMHLSPRKKGDGGPKPLNIWRPLPKTSETEKGKHKARVITDEVAYQREKEERIQPFLEY